MICGLDLMVRISKHGNGPAWVVFVLVLGISLLGSSVVTRAGELHDAVRAEDTVAIETLIEAGADVDESDYLIGTPLHLAVSSGRVQLAASLIDHGANLEAGSEINEMRPLHLASQSNNLPMAKLLMDRGALLEAHDGLQRTPLLVAAIEGHLQMAGLLLNGGAAIDGREGIRNRTPLMMACYFGRLDMVKLLLKRDADINATDSFNDTSLSFAVGDASFRNAGGATLIEYLLAMGADPSIRRRDGLTPLAYAKVRSFTEQAEALNRLGVTE